MAVSREETVEFVVVCRNKFISIKIFKCRLVNLKRLTSTQNKLHLYAVGWRSDEAKWFKPTFRVKFDWELLFSRHTVGSVFY